MGLFPHKSMATMTAFPGTNLIIKKINWIEKARKYSFGAPCLPQTSLVLAIVILKFYVIYKNDVNIIFVIILQLFNVQRWTELETQCNGMLFLLIT